MKRLKDSTIKSYSVKQLAKHLERLMVYSRHKGVVPVYLVTLELGKWGSIGKYRFTGNHLSSAYHTYCDIKDCNRDLIIDAIESQYINLGIRS